VTKQRRPHSHIWIKIVGEDSCGRRVAYRGVAPSDDGNASPAGSCRSSSFFNATPSTTAADTSEGCACSSSYERFSR
jgi:hypothetical protein